MKKVKVLTGYFPAFPAKHLSEDQFRGYGNQLREVVGDGNIRVMGAGYTLSDCWAHQFLVDMPLLLPSDRNPAPDRFINAGAMVASNIVILQRFEWLRMAALIDPEVDVWVWLEYTIMKQPGVTGPVIKKFLDEVAQYDYTAVSIPGCWPKAPVDDGAICWRFCGSTWVCPHHLVSAFSKGAKEIIAWRTRATGTISWDVNTMAYLELLDVVPIRWYPGNHDETQLTNFRG